MGVDENLYTEPVSAGVAAPPVLHADAAASTGRVSV
jgi:hypothetical protein